MKVILFQINCIPVLCENHRYLLNQKDGRSQRIPIVFSLTVSHRLSQGLPASTRQFKFCFFALVRYESCIRPVRTERMFLARDTYQPILALYADLVLTCQPSDSKRGALNAQIQLSGKFGDGNLLSPVPFMACQTFPALNPMIFLSIMVFIVSAWSKYISYSSFSLLTFAAKKIISYDAAT